MTEFTLLNTQSVVPGFTTSYEACIIFVIVPLFLTNIISFQLSRAKPTDQVSYQQSVFCLSEEVKSCGPLLAYFDTFLYHLSPFWSFLVPCGPFWPELAPFGSFLLLFAPFGFFWLLLAYCRPY